MGSFGTPPPEAPDPDEVAPLADSPEHGGVLDDDLEAAAAAAFDAPAATDTGVVEPEGDEPAGDDETGAGAGTGGDGAEGAPAPPAADPDPNLIEVADGLVMTKEEAASWANFQLYLRENPHVAEAVTAALESAENPPAPTAPAPSAPTTREVPEGIDLDDPAIAALWGQHTATLDHIARLEATVQAHDQYVNHSSQQQMESLLNQARATYKEKHNLSDEEMTRVYDVAGRLQVLPALLSPVDPLTGTPRKADPLAAMQEAFEMARWSIPELREREMQLKVDEQKTTTKRKQKLSSLGGSSGSSPRTVPEPKTQSERRDAMIAAVAAAQNGEGVE